MVLRVHGRPGDARAKFLLPRLYYLHVRKIILLFDTLLKCIIFIISLQHVVILASFDWLEAFHDLNTSYTYSTMIGSALPSTLSRIVSETPIPDFQISRSPFSISIPAVSAPSCSVTCNGNRRRWIRIREEEIMMPCKTMFLSLRSTQPSIHPNCSCLLLKRHREEARFDLEHNFPTSSRYHLNSQ